MINFLKNIFQKQKEANVPVLQEMLKRDEAVQAAYHHWILTDSKDNLTNYLRQHYDAFRQGKERNKQLIWLQSPKIKGFVFKYDAAIATVADFQHLFDYLKAQLLPLGYRSYVSDVKQYARKDYVEKIERHYLKPKFDWDEETGISNQLFGNMTIEQLLHNDQPIQIKFTCTPYVDRKWTLALPFEELMEKVLR